MQLVYIGTYTVVHNLSILRGYYIKQQKKKCFFQYYLLGFNSNNYWPTFKLDTEYK